MSAHPLPTPKTRIKPLSCALPCSARDLGHRPAVAAASGELHNGGARKRLAKPLQHLAS